jgi:hypothetical protein
MKNGRTDFRIVLLFAVIFTTLTFISLGCASGIPPEEAWNKTFGGTDPDGASSVQQTSDGGYILAGYTYSYGAGSSDFWLVKTYSDGSKQWDKTFGGTHYDCIFSVQQTSDDGYILAGVTESYGAGNGDLWLVKADSEGNEQWNRTFGGIDPDCAVSVQQTSDSGYILAGYTESYGAGRSDFWLVKTDSKGNKEWDKTFGGTDHDYVSSVQQTSDGGYILAGGTMSYDTGNGDFWLVKTDSKGNMEWDRTFGGVNMDRAYSVQQTFDCGYILAGITKSYGTGNSDFWLVKTDSKGNKEWDRTFGGVNVCHAPSVQQTSDSGYILAGCTGSYGASSGDLWLVKTDSKGNKEWDEAFGGVNVHRAHYPVQQTSDGGYILAGDAMSYGASLRDAWLIKVGGTDSAPPPAKATELAATSTPVQSGMILATGVMLFGIVFIFFIAYFIRRNYKSEIGDGTRFFIGLIATIVPLWSSGFDPASDAIRTGVIVLVWMWVFIGLKSKYWLAFVGYSLFMSSVFWLYAIAMKISSDLWVRSEVTIACEPFLFYASFGIIPFSLLLIEVYMADKTGCIKKLRKYLKYLYKEKVIWRTNTKKHEEKRREEPKRNERKHEAHKKSAGSTKDDTRPYYYKVLDVSTDASRDEIKKAYRRLSMLYHPDASTDPDAEKKMKEINKAHDVLSDPDKRARYDNFENAFKG